jgi:hypothetical protein
MKPRTLCACQPVARIKWWSVTPPERFSRDTTWACLVFFRPVCGCCWRVGFRAAWRRAGATSPLCSPKARLWTVLQIRAVATARLVNRLTGVKPGIRF